MDEEPIQREGVGRQSRGGLSRAVAKGDKRLVTLLVLAVDLEELQAIVVRAVLGPQG